LIVVVYMAVIDLLGDSRLALAAASLVAFLPMQVDMSAAVTNDSLINLLFALALWRISRLMIRLDQVKDPSPDARSAIILALLLTAAFWTKSQAVILVPVYIVAFCLMAYRHRASARSTLLVGAVTIVLGLVLATPWLMRNKFLYGDLLATQAFTKEFEQTTPTTKAMLNVCARYLVHVGQATPTDPDIGDKAFKTYFWLDTRWSFASFFGVFDSMSLFWGQDPAVKRPNAFGPMPVIYDIFLALSLVVATGLIVSLVRRKPKLTVGQSSALWIYALMIAGVGYVFVFFNLTFFQAQGRYWFPALLPFAAFTALGLRGLLRKPAPYAVGVILISAALVALNAYTVWWLLPARFAAG